MTTTDSTFLTLEDAAERVHVSVKTVRRYIAAGRLTGYRVGPSLIRLDPVEVDKLLRPIPACPAQHLGTSHVASAVSVWLATGCAMFGTQPMRQLVAALPSPEPYAAR